MVARNAEQLILGAAQGYDARALEPFAVSLRRSGYQGRCRIFVEGKDAEAQAFLTAHGIEVETFDSVHARLYGAARTLRVPHALTRLVQFFALRTLQPLATVGGGRALRIYGRLAPLAPSAIRYLFYHACLTGPDGAGVRRVLLVDTSDVIFQRDPFSTPVPDDGLLGSFEESPWLIGTCSVNSVWVRSCYGDDGLRALADRAICNCGVTLGGVDAVILYLRALIREMARAVGWRFVPQQGADQACHNYLFHLAQPAQVTTFANGAAPFVHLFHRQASRLAFSPAGELLNDDGDVVNVVHQWVAHPAVFAPMVAKLRSSTPQVVHNPAVVEADPLGPALPRGHQFPDLG